MVDKAPPGFVLIDGKDHKPKSMQESCTQPLFVGNCDKTYVNDSYVPDFASKPRETSKTAIWLKVAEKNPFLTIICILLPPLTFTLVTIPLVFSWHFRYPKLIYLLIVPAVFPVFIARNFCKLAVKRGADARMHHLLVALLIFAIILGIFTAQVIYMVFMHTYFAIESMKTYTNINPGDTSSARMMDAGQVHFSDKTRLAAEMGMSFTDWDIFCVAPIVDSSIDSQATYDFWAVGINCCRSAEPSFECGEFNNPGARSGLRQLQEDRRYYYNLAVEQAEAAYNIRALNPTFYYWVQDPEEMIVTFFSEGFKSWLLGNMGHFCINFMVVLVCAIHFAKPR